MASKKKAENRNKPKHTPAEAAATQRRAGQELLVDGRRDEKRDGFFPIVGRGASAAGLEALGEFFSRMPSDGDGKVAGLSCVAVDITFAP